MFNNLFGGGASWPVTQRTQTAQALPQWLRQPPQGPIASAIANAPAQTPVTGQVAPYMADAMEYINGIRQRPAAARPAAVGGLPPALAQMAGGFIGSPTFANLRNLPQGGAGGGLPGGLANLPLPTFRSPFVQRAPTQPPAQQLPWLRQGLGGLSGLWNQRQAQPDSSQFLDWIRAGGRNV